MQRELDKFFAWEFLTKENKQRILEKQDSEAAERKREKKFLKYI